MEYAPAISTIISPKYLAEFVINRYGFNQNTTCRVLKTGINHSYLVAASDKKFVLRVYSLHWRTESEIREELTLLDYLKERGISVSYPIKNRDDCYINGIGALEGERLAVLFSHAEGEMVKNPSENAVLQLGSTMAKMHRLTVNRTLNRKSYDANSLVNWALQLAKEHFPGPSSEMQYFARANAVISSVFEKANQSALRYGIVHLDLWYENMKIKDDDEITIFDFDNCGNGWLFLDIAYTLMIFFRNEPNKEKFTRKRAVFYQGYESVASVSEEEKRLIPYGSLAVWLHYTGVHVQRFSDFSNPFLSKEFLKYWLHTVNLWMEFNEIKI